MASSRTEYVKKNIFYGYIGSTITSLLQMICRTIFVYTLGAKYLGVSGLFTNVLGVLSFSELGIGTAIVFSLYKPIAEEDKEKIKALLDLYKKAYVIIAFIIALFGLLLIPFLNFLVNTDIPMCEIRIYYFIFLFDTVTSYFVSYQNSYLSALQKGYIVTNFGTIVTIILNILQIILLLLGGNYLEYLLIFCFVRLFQKIIRFIYLNKKFPILTEKNTSPLDLETKKDIVKNVKALIVHRIGDVSVNQTDNIIISAFVSTTTVGILSNYISLNSIISTFTDTFFGSFIASFGNMIAIEKIDKQRYIFDVYDLLGFWVFAFVLISFITLSQPFITLWLGNGLVLDNFTMVLYFVSLYLANMTLIPYNFKTAAGKFNEDKWVSFIEAIVNLVASIIAVKIIGLPGIFIGTIISRMIVVIFRPYIVFKYVFNESCKKYFVRFILRTLLAFVLCFILWQIKKALLFKVTISRFIIMCFLVAIIPNVVFFIIFGRSKEFKDILSRIKR